MTTRASESHVQTRVDHRCLNLMHGCIYSMHIGIAPSSYVRKKNSVEMILHTQRGGVNQRPHPTTDYVPGYDAMGMVE